MYFTKIALAFAVSIVIVAALLAVYNGARPQPNVTFPGDSFAVSNLTNSSLPLTPGKNQYIQFTLKNTGTVEWDHRYLIDLDHQKQPGGSQPSIVGTIPFTKPGSSATMVLTIVTSSSARGQYSVPVYMYIAKDRIHPDRPCFRNVPVCTVTFKSSSPAH